MAEPNKQQIGDGADSYGAAAQNAAKAAKQAAKSSFDKLYAGGETDEYAKTAERSH